MAIDGCRDLAMYEDGENYIKAIYIGMGAYFGKSYHVYSYINGYTSTHEFATEYSAINFYEKLCFHLEQRLEIPIYNKIPLRRTTQK